MSGIFRIRLPVFMLGALVSGSFFIAIYEGISYFLSAEVARRIGNAGSKAVLGVVVIVAIGLGIWAGWSRWRAREQPSAEEHAPRGHNSQHTRHQVLLVHSEAGLRRQSVHPPVEHPGSGRGGDRRTRRKSAPRPARVARSLTSRVHEDPKEVSAGTLLDSAASCG
jgi:hypothetical protein